MQNAVVYGLMILFFFIPGYFSLERQLSCDSVSSVTSTVSGASLASYSSLGCHNLQSNSHNSNHISNNHIDDDQSKNKKRSWVSRV